MADSESEYSSDDEEWKPEENESDSSDHEEESKDKQKKGDTPLRKRKGGIQLEEEGEEEDDEEEDAAREQIGEESELNKLKKEKQEASNKARIDDLWADFKKDTKTTQAKNPTSSSSLKSTVTMDSVLSAARPQVSKPKQVTISKTYDFAGETVTVTKTVDAESAEAKTKQKDQAKPAGTPTIPGHKRPAAQGGLSSVLGQLGKRPKMSTLEKSKYDWDTFKKDEGIEEELKNFNKDGYLEKKSFLQRTDERQFERERDVRLGMRKI